MKRLKYFGVCFSLCCVLTASVGCGPKELPKRKLYTARGTVTMNGEPVRFAAVFFHPKDITQGLPADGETDENGVFSLRTYANDGVPDGAAAGVYAVTIGDYPGAPPEGATPTRLPKRPLELEAAVEVAADDNDLTIEIP
jgi:hypothetical protein